MTQKRTPPRRFRDDPDGPWGLSEAIEQDEQAAVPYDMARGLAALTGAMGVVGAANAAPVGQLARIAKFLRCNVNLIVSFAALGGLAGGVALEESREAQPPAEPAHELSPPPSAINVGEEDGAQDRPKVVETSKDDLRRSPPSLPSKGTTTAPTPSAASNASMRDEIVNLTLIRAAMKQDPERALALAQDGEHRFAGGLFAEEREASIVIALVRLGRPNEAGDGARAFLARYPRSPFREQVERAIGQEEIGERGP